MKHFSCEAMDALGKTHKGLVEAESANQAVAKLKAGNYFPTRIQEAKPDEIASTPPLPLPSPVSPGQVPLKPAPETGIPEVLTRCKLRVGVDTFEGEVTYAERNAQPFVLFYYAKRSAADEGRRLEIPFDEMAELKLGGWFTKKLTIQTRNGKQYVFRGSLGRIGQFFRYVHSTRAERKA
jgi:hypothetical protein